MKNIILIILVIAVIGGGVLVYSKYTATPKSAEGSVSTTPNTTSITPASNTIINEVVPQVTTRNGATVKGDECKTYLSVDEIKSITGTTVTGPVQSKNKAESIVCKFFDAKGVAYLEIDVATSPISDDDAKAMLTPPKGSTLFKSVTGIGDMAMESITIAGGSVTFVTQHVLVLIHSNTTSIEKLAQIIVPRISPTW